MKYILTLAVILFVIFYSNDKADKPLSPQAKAEIQQVLAYVECVKAVNKAAADSPYQHSPREIQQAVHNCNN